MFILRFIGRILSIGFILFIVLVVLGKHARADNAWAVNRLAVAYSAAREAAIVTVPVQAGSLRR